MKKITTFIAFVFAITLATAQPGSIDTVKANLSIKVNDWCYVISYFNGSTDSSDISFVRKVRTKILAVPNVTMNTNVLVDLVPGRYLVNIYDVVRKIPAGEATELGNATANAIRAIANPVLKYYIGMIDSQYGVEHRRHVRIGKNMLVDN